PMIALKKLAIVSFDVMPGSTGSGGEHPFMLVLFVPLDTSNAMTDAILQVVEPRVDAYKNGQAPDLENLQENVLRVLESTIVEEHSSEQQGNLKRDFMTIVKEHLSKMTSKGIALKVIFCPLCGSEIYPDELACTHCRFIVRTFCAQCNAVIERSLKFCSKCGLANPKYDPAVWLVTNLDEYQKGVENSRRENTMPGGRKNLEKELDASINSLDSEIQTLKEELEAGNEQGRKSKVTLYETFTRDRAKDESVSRFQDLMLQNPASSEAVRLIQHLAGDLQDAGALNVPEGVLLSWDCDAFLHAAGRVLVGSGSRLADAGGIPGTIFITETALIFVSYKEEPGEPSRFSYFDASLQHVGALNTFSLDLKNNAILFENHGMSAKKFPLEHTLCANFSWIAGENEDTWVTQAIKLRSMLLHQKLYPKKPPAPAGMFFQFIGKPPSDNAIKNVLASLQLNFPDVLKIVKEKYPVLF
nr:zinc ribbon domain-containing protein [Candidatus Sigynarchaeota archaeon]